MQRYEWYGFLFGMVAVIVFLLAAYMRLKSKPDRYGDLRATISSPQGKFSAAIYVKKGNDSDADSFTLRLKPAGKEFAADSKVFTAAQNCEILNPTWKSDAVLAVSYASTGTNPCKVKSTYHWRGVTIKTVSLSANGSTTTVAARDKK